ncbi:hypothetical protein ACGFX4_24270 [Kitasatospora sp. NPDC048365]|uniref:hypothetical protein n=1 Tax=Kitasatospora sp. NPDC048365 TaxID=3364050 RepID=UPI00370FCFE7
MRTRTLGLTVAAAAAAATTFSALPAHAAADELRLEVAKAVAIAPAPDSGDATATPLLVGVNGHLGGGVQKTMTLTYDTTGLAGVASFTPDTGWGSKCTVQGQVHTCSFAQYGNDKYPDFNHQLQPKLTPLKGVKPGTSGHIRITETWDGGPVNTADTTVYVGGPDLQFVTDAQNPENVEAGKPGSTVKQVFRITNKGTVESGRLVLVVNASTSLTLKQRFANCEYAHRGAGDNGQYSWTDEDVAICAIDTSVKPGETVTVDPIELGLGADALYTDVEVLALSDEGDGTEWWRKNLHFEPVKSGPRLTVGKPETPGAKSGPPNVGPYSHNTLIVQYHADSTADFAAQGGWAPTDGGKKGVLTIGAHNAGPASVGYLRSGEPVAQILVKLPAGAAVSGKLPEGCGTPSDQPNTVNCSTDMWLPNGGQRVFALPLTVSDPASAPKAKVGLTTSEGTYNGGKYLDLPFDRNSANNTVDVALGSKPSGSVPTGPTAHPTPTDPQPTRPRPSGSASGSAHPSASATASGTAAHTGGNLASTGASGIGPMVGGGIAAIALGGGVIALVARRRKAGAHQ